MIFNVDYHFHPNLPRNKVKALIKCKKYWEALKNNGINTVIITEHCYKNPRESFEFMKKTMPKGFFIFPGIEYITKEGVDIVIFSKSKKIYNYKELEPFNLKYDETIKFILRNNLSSFITHPCTVGMTSIISKLGEDKYFHYVNNLNSVEIVNSSFCNLYKMINKSIFRRLFNKKINRIEKTISLPRKYYPRKVKFLAVSSDAHYPEELGTYATIKTTSDKLFSRIITNKNPLITTKNYSHLNGLLLMKTAITSFGEFLLKKTYLIRKLKILTIMIVSGILFQRAGKNVKFYFAKRIIIFSCQ